MAPRSVTAAMNGAKPALAAMVAVLLAACGTGADRPGSVGASQPLPSVERSIEPVASASRSEPADPFPIEVFTRLSSEPVSGALADELQAILDASANRHGLTATVITASGTWSGATGMATAERAMVPRDQMAVASIVKTFMAAQVMQLVEAGELSLDDLASEHLPHDLEFDTNGARIVDLLSMRSGIPDYFPDGDELAVALANDPLRVWAPEEVLATVPPERGAVGQDWEYVGTNFLLLGMIVEQMTGRSYPDALRNGVLAGDDYERLVSQPSERPTDPIALPSGVSAAAFEALGAYLDPFAAVTLGGHDGAIASDAPSLARWFRNLCAGKVVTPASLEEMTDFVARPEYGLGVIDRSGEYWPASGAMGHTGQTGEGYTTLALCFRDPASVVVVLANEEHDVDTLAGLLVEAARSR